MPQDDPTTAQPSVEANDDAARGQITAEAAEIYEAFFVPALFGQFSPPLVEAAGASRGSRMLDIATGTGSAARAGLAAGASVTAVDLNEGMLTVARRIAPEAEFHAAPAEALPFPDASFDAVTCQFGLMFFEDRARALSEMARTCRPGGRVAVSVFQNWEASPGYSDLIPLIGDVVGPEAAEALKAPFCLGGEGRLAALMDESGLAGARITPHSGKVRHTSLDSWLDVEIGGWTLASMVSPAQLDTLKARARTDLARYIAPDGSVAFAAPAIFAVASI